MKKLTIATVALALAVTFTAGSALARGPWAANKGNTVGWQLMTPAERTEHQTKMRSFKTYAECTAYQDEHHKLMEARAKEKSVTLPAMGSRYGCDNMKARGYLK
jgi:hypothetical protein